MRRPPRRYPAPLSLLLLLAACDAPPPADRGGVAEARPAVVAESVELATARRVVGDFFQAFVDGRAAEARDLLAPGPRSDASEEELLAAREAVRSLAVEELEPLVVQSERIVFRATLAAEPEPGVAGEWIAGENVRWVEVIYTRRGWRLGRVSAVPIGGAGWAPVTAWMQVHNLEGGFSVDVPHGWTLAADSAAWTWSPEGGGPRVAVRWVGGPVEDAASALPAGARVVQATPMAGEWGTGTEFLLEGYGGRREAAVVVAGEGGATVVVIAHSAAPEDLAPLRSVIRRMAQSVETGSASSIRSSRDRP